MLQVLPQSTLATTAVDVPPASQLQGFLVAPPPEHHPDLPALDLEVTVITEAAGLRSRIEAWQRLAETAIEANVFYEWWFLIPAFERLKQKNADVAIVVVEAPLRVCGDERRVLCGIFPVEFRCSLRGLPARTLEMWQHDYCYLTTPLVRRDVADATLGAFLDWLDRGRSRLWHLPQLSSGGPFDVLLTRLLGERKRFRFSRDRHSRAILVRRSNVEAALRAGISKKRRHEIRRLNRKLASTGVVTTETLETDGELGNWIGDFLQLEAAGWKGRQETAVGQEPSQRSFFRTMMEEAARFGRLDMIRLRLDGQTIAIKINLRSGDGAFCFKIAYDERFTRFSPGVLLEVSNIELMHERGEIAWMDSCAVAGHPMIETLWPDRRTIESVVVPGRRTGSTWLAAAVPLFRALKATLK